MGGIKTLQLFAFDPEAKEEAEKDEEKDEDLEKTKRAAKTMLKPVKAAGAAFCAFP